MITFVEIFCVIGCVVGVSVIFLGTILAAGSPAKPKQAQSEPTELDTELEAHIDSFEGRPHKKF